MILGNLLEAANNNEGYTIEIVSKENKLLARYKGKDSMKKGFSRNDIIDIKTKNNTLVICTR